MMDVFILGTSGTVPCEDRPYSSALTRIEGECFLFDCGEGTQVGVQKTGVGFSNISNILISHLHADHVMGLVGVLIAIGAAKRTKPVIITGPVGIANFVKSMRSMIGKLSYPIKFIELEKGTNKNYMVGKVRVETTSAMHSVPCFAYSVNLERRPKFKSEKAKTMGIPMQMWSVLSKGNDLEYNGVLYRHTDFEEGARKGLKMSYVTDTRPLQSLRTFVSGSDVAVIEGMYKDDFMYHEAVAKKHMIWKESYSLVSENNVAQTIFTHFSPSEHYSYDDVMEVCNKYKGVQIGMPGLFIHVTFDDMQMDVLQKHYHPNYFSNMKKDLGVSNSSNMTSFNNPRYKLIKKYYQSKGVLGSIKNIQELSAFSFEVFFKNFEKNIVYVYKSKSSMKGLYDDVQLIDDCYIFCVKKRG